MVRYSRITLFGILGLFLWCSQVQASEYRHDELIVKFKAHRPHAASMVTGIDSRPCVIAVDDVQSAIDAVQSCEDVDYVEPNYIIEAEMVPNDWPYTEEWAEVELDGAWNLIDEAGVRKQVVIAVVDSGVDLSHPDLRDIIIPGYDFANNDPNPEDDTGHGTKVCGIIGAIGDNDEGSAGVAWNIDIAIMPLKFMKNNDGRTTGSLSDAVEAIYYAVDMGVDIINASWGFYSYSRSLEDAIDYARAHGVLFVASAGNSAQNNDDEDHYPSNYPFDNVIAVAAMSAYGDLADFSNFGIETVDIAAPGVGLVAPSPGGGYVSWASGTSFATSFVTGIAALLISQSPELDYRSVREILLVTAVMDEEYSQRLLESGGCINAYDALLAEGSYDTSSKAAPGTDEDGAVSSPEGESGGGGGCLLKSVKRSGNAFVLIVCMVIIVLFQIPHMKDLE
ncbi:MAG: S8 family peptidase [Desulfomonilia bacterium]